MSGDWSSDVCSSDLLPSSPALSCFLCTPAPARHRQPLAAALLLLAGVPVDRQLLEAGSVSYQYHKPHASRERTAPCSAAPHRPAPAARPCMLDAALPAEPASPRRLTEPSVPGSVDASPKVHLSPLYHKPQPALVATACVRASESSRVRFLASAKPPLFSHFSSS